MLLGSGRPRLGAGLVATPEQEAETQRLQQMMQRPMQPPMGGMEQPQSMAQPQMGWADKAGGIGTALMAAQAAIDGDFGSSMQLSGSIGAPRRAMQAQMAAQQQAQMQREQEYADWVRKEQYKAANPGPVNNDTVADYEFYKQQLGPEAARRYLENQTDPIVNIPLPGGQVYMGPRSKAPGSSQLPTAPVGRLTPLAGGGAGNGASNFPSGNPLERPW